MASISPNFEFLLAAGLRKVIFNKYKSYPEEYSFIFNVHSSDRQYEEDASVSGLGLFSTKDEGEAISYDDPVQGFKKRYTHVTYGLGFRVSEEMREDDFYSPMRRMARALGRSAAQTVEIVTADVFNNGFNTSYPGADAKPLFATDHPLVKAGGTEQNKLSTDADLSVTSLRQAINDFEDFTDDAGLKMAVKPRLLVVPNESEWDAFELLKSSGRPDTANNAENAFQMLSLRPFVWHYLTDPDAWFLVEEKDDHELNFF